ncbi:SDR family NAD(P)-dependent oxidoreductase [Bradyrhizobium ontarionense]|uniref:SDR family NAD(P)-dependent oxidoreductase n=1 Tax=Bradyrhizobium ontarionense TaxID=2898149 RepID=A0ABY3R9N2_9BRAD|nr:type I polyketide synthase [Bradyrhizobium sp. A19]UFZ04089.1 SDR family NAD(P)-dependent oxidoreductase [Bradyrhizobium sp. A19]
MSKAQIRPGLDIAVVGMSCRFPGARNASAFWNNLLNGVESISFFSRDELIEAGIDPKVMDDPHYVRAKGMIEDADRFDNEFFGYSPREARMMDPQIRVFHEVCWEALEDAGYEPGRFGGLIGLHAGAAPNTFWEILAYQAEAENLGNFTVGIHNNKDYLSSHIAYNFDLKGPSFTLFTACSTSMVAIHQACQALLSGDCDLGMAGSVAITLPLKSGYRYTPGMIVSPDGHCRAFDGAANGTVYGDGAGVVILKRAEEAVRDRDHIYAVIKGSAINNDGSRKTGYTAPSVQGQTEVIRAAMDLAQTAPDEIGYVETHGTGTVVGDPLEFEGLKEAFETERKGFCGLGSVKPNIGHLDVSAGVASFIKTALILKHRIIPPTLHFQLPNPRMNLVDSPFYLVADQREWPASPLPRRAGVSAFGLGGTNVHMILEEHDTPQSPPSGRPLHLLLVSARSETALEDLSQQMADHIRLHEDVELADVAHTLMNGRKRQRWLRVAVAEDRAMAVDALLDPKHPRARIVDSADPRELAVFVFTDEPTDVQCAQNFLRYEPLYCQALSRCLDLLEPRLAADVRAQLENRNAAASDLAGFCHQYAAACWFIEQGVQPGALAGFGRGELLSACLSGTLRLSDCLGWIVSGNAEIQPSADARPRIPYLSNVTGEWITSREIGDANYWRSAVFRQPASGSDHLTKALGELASRAVFLQIGAKGRSDVVAPHVVHIDAGAAGPLFALADLWAKGAIASPLRLYAGEARRRVPLPTSPFERKRFWIDGSPFNGKPAVENSVKREGDTGTPKQSEDQWFYVPVWRESAERYRMDHATTGDWLVFADPLGLGDAIAARLIAAGRRVAMVRVGVRFVARAADTYELNPGSVDDYVALFAALEQAGFSPAHVCHLWAVTPSASPASILDLGFYSLLYLGQALGRSNYYHAITLNAVSNRMHHIAGSGVVEPEKAPLLALLKVLPQESPTMLCRAIDVDVTAALPSETPAWIERFVAALCAPITETVMAYRQGIPWTRRFEQLPAREVQAEVAASDAPPPGLRYRGVYMITGGLGQVAGEMSRYLARSVHARLALTSRGEFPERSSWDRWIATHAPDDKTSARIHMVRELESLGADVLVCQADAADEASMRTAIAQAEAQFGALHGFIHGAGIVRAKSGRTPIESITRELCEEQFRPKMTGLTVAARLLHGRTLDFRIAISSLAPILGGLGHVAYAAANLYMDGFAESQAAARGERWVVVNWAEWEYDGPALFNSNVGQSLKQLELTREEGTRALRCVLTFMSREPIHQVVISTGDLESRIDQWIRLKSLRREPEKQPTRERRTAAPTDGFRSPRAAIESIIGDVWCDFFGVDDVDTSKHFFELGASSLELIHLVSRLGKALKRHVPIEDMLEQPTIRALAAHLAGDSEENNFSAVAERITSGKTGDIAIIGMSGRFPGADNLDIYWDNLRNGIDSVSRFMPDELGAAGVPEAESRHPNYIPAKGFIPDQDRFDAEFFNYTAIDSELLDPQTRAFHECVWHALEDACIDPAEYKGAIGLYGGASPNLYWQVLATFSEAGRTLGQFTTTLLNDKDSLTNTVSYKLGLRGPSVNLFTGCSTSLVAVDSACRAIWSGLCDIAVAGAVSLTLPERAGYVFQEGMLFSSSGHCRAFDANADGMVFGDGWGAVVLKPLEDALRDGDNIHAVIKATASNNDGSRKAGYTSVSAQGQAEVIRTAQAMAGVAPETVNYVETHGTGTRLGDTIELKALGLAFGPQQAGRCAIGSVKSNLGHLMAAAGMAGLIKTALAMQHRQIPPSLHYENHNPEFIGDAKGFYVNTQLSDWKPADTRLRAGVSSFGIGGTNAHVVLEEAPARVSGTRVRHWKILTLSAATETALTRQCENLADYMVRHPDINLSDAAFSLQVGRRRMPFRRSILCESTADAVASLREKPAKRVRTWHAPRDRGDVVFMFPGQGAQRVNMGRSLYVMEPVFRQEIDRCFDLLAGALPRPARDVLYPDNPDDRLAELIGRTEFTQPLMFALEYALARTLMAWGIRPAAMIGYSFGEYAAACLAGVFSLEDALALVTERGRIMASQGAGAMLSVPLPESELEHICARFAADTGERISIAVDNGDSCIVAGTVEAIATFELRLRKLRLLSMRIPVAHAGHSIEMDTLAETFLQSVQRMQLRPPEIPFVSSVTGRWITSSEATDPAYWVRHLRDTVRFAAGAAELGKNADAVFIEVGPGRDLAVLANRLVPDGTRILHAMKAPQSEDDDCFALLDCFVRLWLLGVRPDWSGFYADERRLRIPLPGYPFDHKRYWIEGNPLQLAAAAAEAASTEIVKREDVAEWFYTPQWRRTVAPEVPLDRPAPTHRWLVFADSHDLARLLLDQIGRRHETAIVVTAGSHFAQSGEDGYQIDPDAGASYDQLCAALVARSAMPTRIVHLWGIDGDDVARQITREAVSAANRTGFYSLLYLAQALNATGLGSDTHITVVTRGLYEVTGDEPLYPEKAAVAGPVLCIPQQLPHLQCAVVDIEIPARGSRREASLVVALLAECLQDDVDRQVAYRGRHRWVLDWHQQPLQAAPQSRTPWREHGVYMITGGFGGVAGILAEHLARLFKARLVLTAREPLPAREQWSDWLKQNEHSGDRISGRIRAVQKLEELGAEVLTVAADVADETAMRHAFDEAEAHFGSIHGIIHAAGVTDGRTYSLIGEMDSETCEQQFQAKIHGTYVLDRALAGRTLDFCVLMSSISTVLGGLGYVAYAAANAFLDAYAHHRGRNATYPWIAVDWSDWKYWTQRKTDNQVGAVIDALSMEPAEGFEALTRVLSWGKAPQLASSPGSLKARLDQWVRPESAHGKSDASIEANEAAHGRPQLSSDFVAASTEIEKALVSVWEQIFRVRPLGIHDDFFELGGDSLKAVTAAARIRKRLGIEIPLLQFFKVPTAHGMAQLVHEASAAAFRPIPKAAQQPHYALSAAQRRHYLHYRLNPANTAYNDPFANLIEGPLDPDKVETVLRQIVARHEALRTSFHVIDGEVVQRIHDSVDFHLDRYECDRHDVRRLMASYVRPFELSKAPLLRVCLIRTGPDRHVLLADFPHIVTDGVSFQIFVQEFAELYSGNALPPVPLQYKDYSEWQRQQDGTDAGQPHHEIYWLDLFSGAIPALTLPTDFTRPQRRSFAGARITFLLDAGLTHDLKQLAADEEVTLYVLLLAAFNVLLHAMSGAQDIVVGSPAAGRSHADLQNVMGTFVNTLPMRNHARPDATLRDFLQEVKKNVLSALEHQDYPLDRLVAQLALPTDLSRNPLFNVMFLLQNTAVQNVSIANLRISPHDTFHTKALFDLMLQAIELDDVVELALEYATDLFTADTAQSIADHYVEILERMALDQDCRIGDFSPSIEPQQPMSLEASGDFSF